MAEKREKNNNNTDRHKKTIVFYRRQQVKHWIFGARRTRLWQNDHLFLVVVLCFFLHRVLFSDFLCCFYSHVVVGVLFQTMNKIKSDFIPLLCLYYYLDADLKSLGPISQTQNNMLSYKYMLSYKSEICDHRAIWWPKYNDSQFIGNVKLLVLNSITLGKWFLSPRNRF